MRFFVAVWLMLVATFVVYGSITAWHALVSAPQAYSRLRDRGVPVTGKLDGCSGGGSAAGSGVMSHVERRCHVTVTFRGSTRSWVYPYSVDEAGGPTLAMLVDPSHPQTAYAVYDVRHSTGAGWNGHAIFGLVLLGGGLLLLAVPPLLN
jgi:hypothetical protein